MGRELTPIEKLGADIAATQEGAIAESVERARRAAPKPPRRRPVWAFAAAAIIVGAVLWAALRPRPPAPLTFEIDSSRQGVVREWVMAPPEREVPVRFSDGSTVLLSASARGQVAEVSPEGARVQIERGRAAVSVPSAREARFTFDVGPFAMAVAGSRFDASWDPASQVFDLDLHDGSARVSGPTIAGARTVVAGQHLHIALAVTEDLADAAPAPPPPPSATAAPPAKAVARPTTPAAPDPAWRALALDGKYDEALAAVGTDFDAVCASASSGDVIALADAARLARAPDRAKRAYGAVRTRFPGAPEASLAAFSLGRMAFQEGKDDDAARWFETYLRESPQGPLAREALGRLMETKDRHGDANEARALAERYLAQYPDGPHAKLARKLREE
jgi:TolA-binding protein